MASGFASLASGMRVGNIVVRCDVLMNLFFFCE
jgi:hypothetical protein